MPIQLLFTAPTLFLAWVAAIIYSITVHEFSHALSGHLQGDPTPESEGRLSLNPVRHIDWLGFALLLLVGFGWGRPVAFNPLLLKYKRFGPALVALAGPFANLISIIVFAVLLRLLIDANFLAPDNLLFTFITFLIEINVILMVFNVLPIPPLDGSKLLYSMIGMRNMNVIVFLERYGIWILFALILVASPLITRVFDFVLGVVYEVVGV